MGDDRNSGGVVNEPAAQIPATPTSPARRSDDGRRSESITSAGSFRRKPVPSNGLPSANETGVQTNGSIEANSDTWETEDLYSLSPSRRMASPEPAAPRAGSKSPVPIIREIPYRQKQLQKVSVTSKHSEVAEITSEPGENDENRPFAGEEGSFDETQEYLEEEQPPTETYQPLHYFHQPYEEPVDVQPDGSRDKGKSASSSSRASSERHSGQEHLPRTNLPRPASAYTLGSGVGRTGSPHLSVNGGGGSPIDGPYGRHLSLARRSPDSRPHSYIDLLNTPYAQQIAPSPGLGNNSLLKNIVGNNASLLDSKKTLEMYRANVKKTQDNAVQYEFAVFMVTLAQEINAAPPGSDTQGLDPAELIREARTILQRLADRSYPFAQYYLADGYASGLFNKGKEDYDRAFPLFVAASKHGHAEAGYRAALCYEFGWGCRKDYAKAVQFYRASASKGHPGAASRLGKACLTGDMGLSGKYREGVKWLKRATEQADPQYNAAPYELARMHETGYGDDVFKDEAYAAQLYTQAADLGHPLAALRMGEAYEHGLLLCPKDPALSVHFYNCAAQAGIPEAMMNLCAWYMVGAEPVLERDENEAYEWAKKAAELEYPKAEYAVGYFTEMGIGCRRDPLEANVWYVKAAEHGEERAKQRLAIIRAAASGGGEVPEDAAAGKRKKGGKGEKDCVVM